MAVAGIVIEKAVERNDTQFIWGKTLPYDAGMFLFF